MPAVAARTAASRPMVATREITFLIRLLLVEYLYKFCQLTKKAKKVENCEMACQAGTGQEVERCGFRDERTTRRGRSSPSRSRVEVPSNSRSSRGGLPSRSPCSSR